jgi:hypothetical protein
MTVTDEMVEAAISAHWKLFQNGETEDEREAMRHALSAALSARPSDAPKPAQPEPVAFQQRVQPWMMACFGPEISGDRLERADRLVEEVLELVQAAGYSRDRVSALASYVFDRPAGEPVQEVGGVMVTLAAFCLAHGIEMHEAGEAELARIWTKVEKIRAKQAAKPTGSALPIASPPSSPIPADERAAIRAEEREAWEAELAPLVEAGAFEGADFATCENCGAPLSVDEVARVDDGPVGCWRYLTGQDRFDCPGDRRKRITIAIRSAPAEKEPTP